METRYISLKEAIDTAKFYEAECDPIPRLIDSLNAIQPADVVSRDCYDRILAENDIMREMLAQIGKKPGDKMDDVRPVVRGEWIKKFMGFPPEPHTLCSCCEYDPDFAAFDLIEYDGCIGLKPFRPNFCPNCGAYMRPEEEPYES